MFIDLTRHGGDRMLRVAAAAIAYLDDAGDSTAVHLMGGQSLRVAEPIAEIEARIGITRRPKQETDSVSIDPIKEAEAINLAEAAGILTPVEATEQRVSAMTAGRSLRKRR